MITIHCGLHKTGSSSIQLALASYRGPARVVVPRPGESQSPDAWADRLSSLSGRGDVIFSDESLLGSPYDGYASAPERVSILARALRGQQARVVVYLRPQSDWLPSVYLQGVQEGRRMSVDGFWSALSSSAYSHWPRLVDLLRDASGAEAVTVRAYDGGHDVVGDFFRTCGLGAVPRVGGPDGIRENVSISAVQAPILAALTADSGMTDADRGQLRAVFQTRLAAGAPRGYSPFPAALQARIVDEYATDWTALGLGTGSSSWGSEARPSVDGALDDPVVQAEMVRVIRLLAVSGSAAGPTMSRRILARLRTDPAGIPSAVMRRFRRPR
jgi:hypothetical protein